MNFRPTILAFIFAISSLASAQGQPPAGAPGMPMGNKIMFRQGGIGTLGSFTRDLPSVGIAYLPIDHMQVGLSLGLTYDSRRVLVYPFDSPVTGMRHPLF